MQCNFHNRFSLDEEKVTHLLFKQGTKLYIDCEQSLI